MICDKIEPAEVQVHVGNELIEQVDKFTYLGNTITWDRRYKAEVRSRIAQAKAAQDKMDRKVTNEVVLEKNGEKFLEFGC